MPGPFILTETWVFRDSLSTLCVPKQCVSHSALEISCLGNPQVPFSLAGLSSCDSLKEG